jgi:hypothetical protein
MKTYGMTVAIIYITLITLENTVGGYNHKPRVVVNMRSVEIHIFSG